MDIKSTALQSRGWAAILDVPAGVEVQVDNPQPRHTTDSNTDYYFFQPGPQASGEYFVLFEWPNDRAHGLYQFSDSSFAASFPSFMVAREYSQGSGADNTRFHLTVSRDLAQDSDYQFAGGRAPDTYGQFRWSWMDSMTGTAPLVPALSVEATSPSLSARSHSSEFKSGVAYGVGAAALIAAIQEFLNRATRREISALSNAVPRRPRPGPGTQRAGYPIERVRRQRSDR